MTGAKGSVKFRSWPVKILLVLLAAGTGGCKGQSAAGGSGGESSTADALPDGAAAATSVAALEWSQDPCSWISAAEVEAIAGPLAGPPRPHEGGCLYPLPEDVSPEALRRQEAARKLKEGLKEFAQKSGTSLPVSGNQLPTEPALIVHLSLDASASDRGLRVAEDVMRSWLGPASEGEAAGSSTLVGWDFARSPIAIGLPGFLGRVGQLTVMVQVQATPTKVATLAALAAAVRDRVPDGPFAAPSGGGSLTAEPTRGTDPCSLITREQAEAVLGALLMNPYRGHTTTPYPDPLGPSCVYHTARHHTFRLTPFWEGGRSQMEAVRTTGDPLAAVLPEGETTDTLAGPWDDAGYDAGTGDLVFLSGDRALQVSYGTSSTDAVGAIRLARIALGRLGSAAPP